VAGFEEQLNSILGNQEAMSQIMALARSLSGEQTRPAREEGPQSLKEAEGVKETEGDTYVPVEGTPPAPDLSALLGQVDPRMVQMGMEILRQVQSTEDRNTALLNALRPFLREERQARLDRAIQIARTARLVRAALGALKEKEGERV